MMNPAKLNVVIPISDEIRERVIASLPLSLGELTGFADQHLVIGQSELNNSIESFKQTLEGLALGQFRLEFGSFKTRTYPARQNPYEVTVAIKKTKKYNAFKESLVQGIRMKPVKNSGLLIASEIPFSFNEAMDAFSNFKPKNTISFVVNRLILTNNVSGVVEIDFSIRQESMPLFPIL
ncbi:hypothetical protein [Dyadobacter sp. CY326]|uniref:hypothetical protein n=1 Tax=Dyadobacter sp. CY326 TaxID=2907300 RepID=UPI001F1FC378|nr:hypothetical protein [Dyadobacter sp. CY326]MCE7065799.1 hypothetical protein [Dyadobacter sp. CY326]